MSNDQVNDGLKGVLAESYALMVKSHNYHWNVTGPHFGPLHALFETHYTDLFAAVDEIAERLRALDGVAPGSFKAFDALRQAGDPLEGVAADAMLDDLAADHALLSTRLKALFEAASRSGDEATADLCISRLHVHDKARWMLLASRSKAPPAARS